jgi:ATP-dependent protease HslVU (ClpYQ) peptidase subunit
LGKTVLGFVMTCIVGLEHHGRVYIGGDSAGIAGTGLCVRADAKVFRNGPFLIGFTTSFRMGQLLQFKLKPPPHPADVDTFEFLVGTFVDTVRSCLKSGGFARRKEEQEIAGAFLVGYRGRLYTIDSDYQVGQSADRFGAAGAGAQLALGALHALDAILNCNNGDDSQTCSIVDPVHQVVREKTEFFLQKRFGRASFDKPPLLTPEQRITIALQAAERWNSTVRSPFTVLSN